MSKRRILKIGRIFLAIVLLLSSGKCSENNIFADETSNVKNQTAQEQSENIKREQQSKQDNSQKSDFDRPILGEPEAVAWIMKMKNYVEKLEPTEKQRIIDKFKEKKFQEILTRGRVKEVNGEFQHKKLTVEETKKKIEELTPEAERIYNIIVQLADKLNEEGVLPVDFEDYIEKNYFKEQEAKNVIPTREEYIKYCESKPTIRRNIIALEEKDIENFKKGKYFMRFLGLSSEFSKCQSESTRYTPYMHSYQLAKNKDKRETIEEDDSQYEERKNFGIYTTSKTDQESTVRWFILDKGRNCELAFDETEVKKILAEDLCDIFTVMYYNHPEMCYLCYLFDKEISVNLFYSWPSPLLISEIEKIFGIKDFVLNIADILYSKVPCKKEKRKDYKIWNWIQDLSRKVNNETSREYFKKYCDIMENMKSKPHDIDNLYALTKLENLILKLAGYDLIVHYDGGERNFQSYTLLNFNKMTVCGEIMEPKSKDIDKIVEQVKKASQSHCL